MVRPTLGWTDRHTSVASLLTVALVTAMAGLVDGGWVPLLVAAGVVLAGVMSLALDTWGGAVVGLAVTAALVAIRRGTGDWAAQDFPAAAVTALGMVLTGAVAGSTGRKLRARSEGRPDAFWQPVYGSLGLLGHEAAVGRLEEEAQRSSRHGRPLTLALLQVAVTADDLPSDGRDAARRTVARLVENRAGEHDVPFALTADRLGIIFPESPAATAWDVVGDILAAVDQAHYTYGAERAPRPLADAVDLYVGITQHLPERQSAQAMLDAAVTAVERTIAEDSSAAPAPPGDDQVSTGRPATHGQGG